MDTKIYDAVIAGGGASGLVCAISAKTKNSKIKLAIIEKNDRVGKKLMSTGNGRCNLTNKNITIDKYKGSFTKKAESIFSRYTTDYLIDIFSSLGLISYFDSEGRCYPISRHASAVTDVLRFACERLGIDIYCSENIKTVKKQGNTFNITTDTSVYKAKKLVIACGSKAAPKLGGNASGIDYLKNFGYTITGFTPALCPIKVKSEILKSLKGIRSTCTARLNRRNGKTVKTEVGEVQFTENALSGICIFNLSLYSRKGDIIELDLLSDYSYNELLDIVLKQKQLFGQFPIENLFTGIFQKKLGQALLKLSGITDFSRTCKSLINKEIKLICSSIKNMKFEVIENSGFEQAQCSLGGVADSEINEKTMESTKVKGLYVVGEAIDICGECGGFNLHFAFASGHLAGENL